MCFQTNHHSTAHVPPQLSMTTPNLKSKNVPIRGLNSCMAISGCASGCNTRQNISDRTHLTFALVHDHGSTGHVAHQLNTSQPKWTSQLVFVSHLKPSMAPFGGASCTSIVHVSAQMNGAHRIRPIFALVRCIIRLGNLHRN